MNNTLESTYPHLISEWHPSKNNGALPKDFAPYSNKKVWWICSNGHEWQAIISKRSKRGDGCPKCSKSRKKTIQEMKEFAVSKGGKCISSEYVNSKSLLKFECDKGHVFETNWANLYAGSWCPNCSSSRKNWNIKDMQKLAKVKNGKCLSHTYEGDKIHLIWECAIGHQWKAVPGSIKAGTWCPICAGQIKITISDLKALATSRGGKCLSEKYFNVDSQYEWECNLGHRWINRFSKIKKGQWCPTCSKSGISEEVARTTFENIFGVKFKKSRPKWLKNSRGNQMELDGYNKKLKIGFEYHGRQHFKIVKLFTPTKDSLNQRIEDDKFKLKLCKEQGVKLFVLTYKHKYFEFNKHIRKQAIDFGIDITQYKFQSEIDFSSTYVRDDRIIELRQILNEKQIDLLSNHFLGVKHKYKMKCRIDEHTWSTSGSEIIAGAGCKKCAMRKLRIKQTGSLEDVVRYAEKYDGILLTKEYKYAKGKYKFQCKKGHIFEARLSNLKFRKQWCPICEGRQVRKKKE